MSSLAQITSSRIARRGRSPSFLQIDFEKLVRHDYADGVRKAALAHKCKSETTAAYRPGKKLATRRALMKEWVQFLGRSNVIPFRQGSLAEEIDRARATCASRTGRSYISTTCIRHVS